MQRWEYCMLVGDETNPGLVFYGAAGPEQQAIAVDPAKGDRTAVNAWMRVVGELGLAGWELVNAHPVVGLSTTATEFFFKRPVAPDREPVRS